MRVEIGTPVETRDGKEVGRVDRLILDPTSGEVKAVVVRQGAFFAHDVAINLTDLQPGAGDAVRLTLIEEQVDDLPEFNDEIYTGSPSLEPPSVQAPPVGYPTGTMARPISYGVGPPPVPNDDYVMASTTRDELDSILTRERLENAVIGAGSEVRSRDGKKVGEVHRLAFDETGQLRHLVVRRGFIFRHEVEVPASQITSADSGVLVLDVNAVEIEAQQDR